MDEKEIKMANERLKRNIDGKLYIPTEMWKEFQKYCDNPEDGYPTPSESDIEGWHYWSAQYAEGYEEYILDDDEEEMIKNGLCIWDIIHDHIDALACAYEA